METPRDTERKTEERDASRGRQTFRERKDGGMVTGGDGGEMDWRIERERHRTPEEGNEWRRRVSPPPSPPRCSAFS